MQTLFSDYNLAMARFFLILLLSIFPLQMSWAMTSAYCQHEQGQAAHHFAHHEHQHHADNTTDTSGTPANSGDLDNDCSACHLTAYTLPTPVMALPLALTAARPVSVISTPILSIPSAPPEKPNWLHPLI